jgi:hypothetical protein
MGAEGRYPVDGDGTFHGTNGGMTQGLTEFPAYASEQNVKPVAR